MLEQFADFAASKPAAEKYHYFDNHGCAYCHFLDFMGIQFDWVGGDAWCATDSTIHYMEQRLVAALSDRPWTFGALAKRLRSQASA